MYGIATIYMMYSNGAAIYVCVGVCVMMDYISLFRDWAPAATTHTIFGTVRRWILVNVKSHRDNGPRATMNES